MNIRLTELPNLTNLIASMDKHPLGAAMFVVALLIVSATAVVSLWIYLYFNR